MKDEQKQIEEMAKELSPYGFCKITKCENCNRKKLSKCRYYSFAKRCVMNGYRKQSDTAREIAEMLKAAKAVVKVHFEAYDELIENIAAEYGVEVEE